MAMPCQIIYEMNISKDESIHNLISKEKLTLNINMDCAYFYVELMKMEKIALFLKLLQMQRGL